MIFLFLYELTNIFGKNNPIYTVIDGWEHFQNKTKNSCDGKFYVST